MIRGGFVVAMFVVLLVSGCAERNTPVVGDVLGASMNATDALVNNSGQAENTTADSDGEYSLVFNLKKPPKEVIGGE